MIPPNPAFRRVRVRFSALLALAICVLAFWSGAQGTAGSNTAGSNTVENTAPEPTPNAGWVESRGLQAAVTPASTTSPPSPFKSSPFKYLHGAQPRPTARPNERVVFTLDGRTGQQTFTLRQLQALPAVRYTTCQPQLQHDAVYEGVPLRDLAMLGGFAGRDVRVYARNGFVTTIRAQDYLTEPIMLAYRTNGQPIPVLAKGPLMVVLPRTPQRFYTPAYAAAWVWFAVRLGPVP